MAGSPLRLIKWADGKYYGTCWASAIPSSAVRSWKEEFLA
jgi:hypothetical protein